MGEKPFGYHVKIERVIAPGKVTNTCEWRWVCRCLSSSPYEIIREADEVAVFECKLHEVQGRLSDVIPALGLFSAEGGQAGFGLYHRRQ